jgi:glycosyltransferase involved in cell wall biosynthesis
LASAGKQVFASHQEFGMKLLILGSKEYPFGVSDDKLPAGGMEAYVQELAKHLVEEKIYPIVITRQFEGLRTHEKKNGIKVHRVSWLSGFWLRGPSFNFFSFIKSLSLDFDIILTNGLPSTVFGYILSKIKNKPLVAVPHGTLHNQRRYGQVITKIAYFLEKYLYSGANLVLLSDEEAKRFKESFGITKANIIPTPVNMDKFKPAAKTKSKGKLKIVFSGRLAEVKGLDYLLKAIPLLKGNFELVILGAGSEEEKYKQLAKELRVENKVKFLGFITKVNEILANADIFVLPSLSEGLPLSLLEAMASGCACVVTNIGLPVKNNENALVVPAKNSEKLAEAINELIKNKNLRLKLGKSAINYVKQFSWENAAKQFKQLFESLDNKNKA